MSALHIILDRLPSLCQKLSDLVEVLRSYNKNNFACFLLRHGVFMTNRKSHMGFRLTTRSMSTMTH